MTQTRPLDGRADSARSGDFRWRWLNLHYVSSIEVLSLTVVILNLVDYWTSTVALGKGFVEGNSVITALSNLFGLQASSGLALLKTLTIIGTLIATVFGIRIGNLRVKETAMIVMVFLATLLLAVSLNNLHALAST